MAWTNLDNVYVSTNGGTITGDLNVNGTLTINDKKGTNTTYDVASQITSLRDSVSPCKVYCGTIVTNDWSGSEVCLFRADDFKETFGRKFDRNCDAVTVMNGDADAQGGVFYQVRYYGSENIWVSTNITNQGSIRLNYIVALGR